MSFDNTPHAWTTYESPLGRLTLIGGAAGLRQVRFPGRTPSPDPRLCSPHAFSEVIAQLDQYFAGERRTFELELDLSGTAFQLRVWRALQAIAYGRTTSYGRLARELEVADAPGAPAARKVGWAVAATPIPVIVPCHRVVAADGSLTGYRGGLHRKRALLDFEAIGGEPEALRHGGQRQLALL